MWITVTWTPLSPRQSVQITNGMTKKDTCATKTFIDKLKTTLAMKYTFKKSCLRSSVLCSSAILLRRHPLVCGLRFEVSSLAYDRRNSVFLEPVVTIFGWESGAGEEMHCYTSILIDLCRRTTLL